MEHFGFNEYFVSCLQKCFNNPIISCFGQAYDTLQTATFRRTTIRAMIMKTLKKKKSEIELFNT